MDKTIKNMISHYFANDNKNLKKLEKICDTYVGLVVYLPWNKTRQEGCNFMQKFALKNSKGHSYG